VIDDRAVVSDQARLADDVEVGPFTVVGPDVEVGPGTWIGPHVVLRGPTSIGRENRIFQFASVGEVAQDKKYAGEHATLEIGDGNTIREFVTINRGTGDGGGVTKLGHRNWIMAYCHIAHDCRIGDDTVFANNASLAGHVLVDDYVVLGGYSLVHQFCRLGESALLAFGAHVDRDVPPFVIAAGQRAVPRGINIEGVKRRDFPAHSQQALKRAYRELYRANNRLDDALQALDAMAAEAPAVGRLAAFIRQSQRGVIR
jgi:UDP-N-acetylglucosamine acyltransferase